jgi:hypothetical protein
VSDVQRYRRHAQLYGADGVYGVAAADGFEPLELGELALALRKVDPKWRLSRNQAMDLAIALVRAGCRDKDIRRMAGISQPTVREARSRAASTESFGPVHPMGPVGRLAALNAATEAVARRAYAEALPRGGGP